LREIASRSRIKLSTTYGKGSRIMNRRNIITYLFGPPKIFEKSIRGSEVRRNAIPVLTFAPKTQKTQL
jgi:hypothetical protein